jgi:hypothetical protein
LSLQEKGYNNAMVAYTKDRPIATAAKHLPTNQSAAKHLPVEKRRYPLRQSIRSELAGKGQVTLGGKASAKRSSSSKASATIANNNKLGKVKSCSTDQREWK